MEEWLRGVGDAFCGWEVVFVDGYHAGDWLVLRIWGFKKTWVCESGPVILFTVWFKRRNVTASGVGHAFPRETVRDADYMLDLG